VVHVLHAWNDRTIAAVTAVLADESARRGLDVAIVAARAYGNRPQVLPHVRVIDLGAARNRTVAALPRLAGVLRHLSPDVVFAHGNGPTRSTILAARVGRPRPVVVGVEHNHYSTFAWDAKRVRDVANRLLLPRADLVVGVSPGIVDDLAATFPVLDGQLAVVAPPLTRWESIAELAAASVDHAWFDDDIPVVTNVGHVHPRKDQQTLVRAFAHLRDLRGDRAVRLAIIGDDSGEYAVRAKALADELGVASDVVFLGRRENPLAYVARSAAFVLSSRNEGMPVTLLEALACGTPAVSTDCPSGPRWLFQEETCGLLAPVGDHVALGAQLARVLDDPGLAGRLREAGLERAKAFSPARITEQQLALVGLA
jgi:glycosyltransferase involved in cell wall biosynthesis